MKQIKELFYQFWVKNFLTVPVNLKALRIMLTAFFCLALFYVIGYETAGLTVGMGLVAAALIDNDIDIKSAILSTLKVSILFFIFSSLTIIIFPHPLWFGLFLVLSTFVITLAGGINSQWASLGFGTVLIIVYTLIIEPHDLSWYIVPSYFTIGVVAYMISSMLVIWLNPYRPLQNELSEGYRMLGLYIKTKSKFFPSTIDEQELIRNELALINIEIFSQTQKIKSLLQVYQKSLAAEKLPTLQTYVLEWQKLENLHERAVSSHEPYDLLTQDSKNPWLVKGFGKLLFEIGDALNQYAIHILKKMPYANDVDLLWTKNALGLMVEKYISPTQEYILFLYKNINSIATDITSEMRGSGILIMDEPSTIGWQNLLSVNHPRFRHAIRLSLCFLLGYMVVYFTQLDMGAWVLLTSLIVCQQTYNATRQRFFKRVTGTLLGVILGYILVILVPTIWGQLAVLLMSMYLFFKFLKHNYIAAAIFITVYVIAVYNVQSGSGTQVMMPRIWATLLGSVIAYVSIRFIWPEWQYKNLQSLLIKAIDNNIHYLEGIMSKAMSQHIYAENKRLAHQADIALAQGWKSMRIEPKSKRKLLTAARNFTYLNHTLLSYISAMGAHRHNLVFDAEDDKKLEEILKLLEEVKQSILKDSSNVWAQENYLPVVLDDDKPNNIFLKNIWVVAQQMNDAALNIQF